MKRIQSACLEQTSKFETEEELSFYIEKLEKKGTKFMVCDKNVNADKSVVVKMKLQYQNYDVGNYM